jgi:hypothetical protein
LTILALEVVGVWWQVGEEETQLASMACLLEEVEETIRQSWRERRGKVLVRTPLESTLQAGRESGRGEGIHVQAGMPNEIP